MKPRLVRRYGGVERVVHWAYALGFLLTGGSGFAMLLVPGAREVYFANMRVAREVHLTAALLLCTLPVVGAAWDGFRSVREIAREAFHLDADDRRWLASVLGRLVGRRGPLPPQGRLNAGQKVNFAFTLALLAGFVATGLILWPLQSRLFPPGLRSWVFLAHDLLAFLSVPAVLGHVFLATLYPPTRESLRGITTGYVRADWAREHHAKWVGGDDH